MRIKALDGFRFISITMVVMFHFIARWTYPHFDGNYYPYGNAFSELPLLGAGGIGVHLFFILSGFVILFTLERTRSLKDFLLRRLIRLWPTMLLCSILTFVALRLMDPLHLFKSFEVGLKSFLPGLTFTPTSFWNTRYIDSAYWSLEIEAKFYVLAGTGYYLLRHRFVPLWTAAALLVFVLYSVLPEHGSAWFQYLFFPEFLPFFTAGILFYSLFSGRQITMSLIGIAVCLIAGLQTRDPLVDKLCICSFFVLFFVFVYRPVWLRFLHNPIVVAIGVSSYPLYLFHQHAGVVFMSSLATMVPLEGNWQLLYPIFTYALLCGFCFLIYQFFELPIRKLLISYMPTNYKGEAQVPKTVTPAFVKKTETL